MSAELEGFNELQLKSKLQASDEQKNKNASRYRSNRNNRNNNRGNRGHSGEAEREINWSNARGRGRGSRASTTNYRTYDAREYGGRDDEANGIEPESVKGSENEAEIESNQVSIDAISDKDTDVEDKLDGTYYSRFPAGSGKHKLVPVTSCECLIDVIKEDIKRITEQTNVVDGKNSHLQAVFDRYFESNPFKNHPKLGNKTTENYIKSCMTEVYLKRSILMSLDVEAWECNNDFVTEIGLAIYDPRFDHGSLADPKIIHIRVWENLEKRNGRYVPDRADHFIGGDSHVMTLQEAIVLIQTLVDYYSEIDGWSFNLVGHAIKNDIKWLQKSGVNLKSYGSIDTQTIFALSRPKNSPTSLSSCLRAMNIPHGYLHNAANDAYYTLLLAQKLLDPAARTKYGLDIWQEEVEPEARSKKERANEKSGFIVADSRRIALDVISHGTTKDAKEG